MDLDLQQQVKKRLSELPQDVQAAVQSADVAQKIQAIGKKHNLHIDQMGALEDEVYLVMLGFAAPSEFAESVAAELSIAPAASVALATDIGNEIFMPIRASMQAWADDHTAQEDAKLVADTLNTKPAPVPAAPPSPPPTPVSAPAPIAKPAAPDLAAADAMLAQKKVTAPPAAPPQAAAEPGKPQSYKADPYREPVE